MELFVDLVKVKEMVVRHVRLSEQHVHVPRHAPGDWVDGEAHTTTALLNQLGKLSHGVLGLRHRHAVARNNDHVAGVTDAHCRIFWRDAPRREALGALCRDCRLLAAERTEEHVREGAVHGLRHEDRQDEAAGAVEGTRHDQDVVADCETGGARRKACVRVQEGDHDRHVGAADWQHQGDADHEGKHRHHGEHDQAGVAAGSSRLCDHECDIQPDRAEEDGGVDQLLTREGDRLTRDEAL